MSNKDEEMEESGSEGEENELSSEVVAKYKTASDIANQALAAVIKECVSGKKIIDICVLGDKFITDKLTTSYNKGKIEKGIAFPTSVSVNHCVGHFSPLLGDTATLAEGDVAKIDLGVHIDGYISLAAHTIIVPDANATTVSSPQPTTGRKADVICAAYYASECALRLLKPGKKNTEVTEVIKKVAEQFKCEPVDGVLSHQMKRFVIDGNQTIINKQTLEHKVDEFEFEEGQVYAVDIVMSTGDGKAKEMENRTVIYKRAVDQNYLLKMQASRYVLNEINERFPTLPFALRALDEKKGKLGITECLKHDLVHPYPILWEKQGEFVAQFKFTVLITSSATTKLNTQPLPFVNSEYKITLPEIDSLLKTGTKRASKKKKPKKKKTATATTGDNKTATTTEEKKDAMDTN